MKDFMKDYVLSQLKRDGIDLRDDSFYYMPAYEKYGNEFILGVEKTSITTKWYIEKYILDDQRREKLYGSVYSFGVFREYTDVEETIDNLCEELRRYDNREDENEVKRSLFRNDGKMGIVAWIKESLSIDVMSDSYNIRDRYKILYLFYTIQKELGIEIRMLLKRPTLENMDRRFIGSQNNNGDIIGRIKDELTKEVQDIFREDIMTTLLKVVKEWKVLLLMINQHLMVDAHEVNVENLTRILNETNQMVEFYKTNNYILKWEESYSLLERFYFEFSCFENIGIEKDLMDVNQTMYNGNKKIEEVLERLTSDELNLLLDDYKQFVETNLYSAIGSKIYGVSKLTSNQKRKLYNSVKLVYDIYDYVVGCTDLYHGFMTYGFLVILFAEVVFIDKKEIVDNKFYRYKKSYTVNTEVKSGREAHDKAKMLLVQRVMNHYQEARGFKNEIELIRAIESNIDFFIFIVLSQHNKESVFYVHGKLYRLVRPMLFFADKVKEKRNMFKNRIENTTGYNVIMVDKSIDNMFRDYIESDEMLEDIVKMAVDKVKRANKSGKRIKEIHELEMLDDYGDYKSLSRLGMIADPLSRELIFLCYERCM